MIADTGWSVYAGKTLNDDTRHHSGGNRVNVKALSSINSILNHSILLDTIVSQPDTKKKSENTAFLHKLYAIINYDNQIYIAKTTIEEYYNETIKNAARRAYNLKAIKIEPVGGQLGINSSSSRPGTSSTISISNLYQLVKSYDKEFSPAPDVSKYILNADGTPKVFYHGTKEDFTVFKRGEKTGWLGKGIYFAEDKKYAKENGKNIIGAYLRINNPFVVKGKSPNDVLSEVWEKFPQADLYSLSDVLKAKKYDGIVFTHWDKGTIISVFEPTQIKSATDNIGTFDGSNPDIRYSFSKEETDMLLKAMENGGMIAKATDTEVKAGEAVKVEEAKSQTAVKKKSKAKTKKQLQAENKELKADNRSLTKTNEKLASGVTKAQGRASELSAQNQQLKKENAKAQRIAENADKRVEAESIRY